MQCVWWMEVTYVGISLGLIERLEELVDGGVGEPDERRCG